MKVINTLFVTFFTVLMYTAPALTDENLCSMLKQDRLSIIQIPKNQFQPSKNLKGDNTIRADINNDGAEDTVGQFYGGSLRVPYLEIVFNNGESGSFGSDRYGAGSPKEFFLVGHEGRTFILVKLVVDPGYPGIPNYYLAEYAGEYREKFICEAR
jgi:hypothetical protein